MGWWYYWMQRVVYVGREVCGVCGCCWSEKQKQEEDEYHDDVEYGRGAGRGGYRRMGGGGGGVHEMESTVESTSGVSSIYSTDSSISSTTGLGSSSSSNGGLERSTGMGLPSLPTAMPPSIGFMANKDLQTSVRKPYQPPAVPMVHSRLGIPERNEEEAELHEDVTPTVPFLQSSKHLPLSGSSILLQSSATSNSNGNFMESSVYYSTVDSTMN